MKPCEKVTCVVDPTFIMERDQVTIEKYNPDMNMPLTIDIHMHKLVRVDDLYKDGTVFYKTIQKGEGTASPYRDSYVWCK